MSIPIVPFPIAQTTISSECEILYCIELNSILGLPNGFFKKLISFF